MRSKLRPIPLIGLLVCTALCAGAEGASTKVHVITFGKWISAPWNAAPGTENDKPMTIKVRALMVDGRVREYVIGSPHEVTERLFVARRAFRVNDSLPEESTLRWQWQRGGWLLVDRTTGRVSAINLPEFDAFYSTASWYRDYAAYCGVSDDGKRIFAIVAQLTRRKPVMKKPLSNDSLPDDAPPDSACLPAQWRRSPMQVSFERVGSVKETYAIRGHVVDLVNNAEDEEEQEGSN
jgi:hypothetical protein